MLAKKEAEERQRNLREMAHEQWEEEMMKKQTTKETTSNSMNNRASSTRRRRNTGGDAVTLRNKDKLAVRCFRDVNGLCLYGPLMGFIWVSVRLHGQGEKECEEEQKVQ